jgi:hypothetical protein
LGLFRSDYLLHESNGEVEFKQVEFNTIAASFGALSQRSGELHKYVQRSHTGLKTVAVAETLGIDI